MLNSYEHAVSKGTANNKLRQAKVYLGFAVAYSIDYLSPSLIHTAMFVQYLANSFKSPASVKNYFSGAKLWVHQHGGNVNSFLDSRVAEVVKGNENISSHIPAPALPIKPQELMVICNFLDRYSPLTFPHKAALLVGFACFFRASNLLSNFFHQSNHTHALLCQDVISVPTGLKIVVRSSKTISPKNPVVLSIITSPASPLCPVKAWHDYVKLFNPLPAGPAFVEAGKVPLTSKTLVKLIRLALQRAGYQNYHRFSLHSLRRGATQTAAELGASQDDLKAHGTWRTNKGLSAYLNISSSVPSLLASNLPRY